MKLLSITFISLVLINPIIVLANENGAQLYQACIECHGEKGQGDESQEAPRIAGQHEWYIYSSLVAFKSKERVNSKMDPVLENLSDNDFKDLASYIATMK